jgi:hypothetical protein
MTRQDMHLMHQHRADLRGVSAPMTRQDMQRMHRPGRHFSADNPPDYAADA